jgi:DNA-binding LacI/PurR family transcriptional regulator
MVFGDPFFAPLLKGIYQALTARSMLLVMLIPRNVEEMDFARAYMIAGHVGGAILVSLHSRSSLPAQLLQQGLPVVCCGRPPLATPISYADTDNRRGAEIATEHLISLGRRRVATISGDLDMPAARDRLAGYRDALAKAGMTPDPSLEEVGGFVPDRAQIAMERLLINHPDVDAVFVCSDSMAAAAMDVLHQAGKRIPEDVAVIGFDDTPVAVTTMPQLSTMRQPIEALGAEVVNLLMHSMIDLDWEPQQSILSVELVVRESTVGTMGQIALP